MEDVDVQPADDKESDDVQRCPACGGPISHAQLLTNAVCERCWNAASGGRTR